MPEAVCQPCVAERGQVIEDEGSSAVEVKHASFGSNHTGAAKSG